MRNARGSFQVLALLRIYPCYWGGKVSINCSAIHLQICLLNGLEMSGAGNLSRT